MGTCRSKHNDSAVLVASHRNLYEDQQQRQSHSSSTPSPVQAKNRNAQSNASSHDDEVPRRRNSSASSSASKSKDSHVPGYSSGASTPLDDSSTHSNSSQTKNSTNGLNSSSHSRTLLHSSSVLGLDKMIDGRRAEGDLKGNIVHMEVPFGKPIEEVYDGVHDGPVLGSGISGLVRLCTHKATGAKYAVKSLDLGLVETEEGLQQLREEIAIMCQLDHPNIVRLEEVYESHSEIYLVQELCVGGELFDRLDEQPDYHYTEAQCARLVKQMLCSVRYIHQKGIIHRDLKLENFLFSTTEADSELKMIDFGLSKHFKFGEVQHEAVGTPYTVAPEVIRGSYDERCDVWAIGVITYLLLSGDPPFGGCGGPESLMQVRSNILRGFYEYEPEEIWQNVSQQAKDFIKLLLVTDPTSRPTAKECQKSPWLQEWAHKDKKNEDNKLNPNVVKALVNFKEYSDMRKLLCEVLSFTLLPDQITGLRREFEKLDTDGSGEISLRGLKQVLISNAGAGSLGALTETEVEDIFNAMRVRKTETRIHWHEFIAAGLSQCEVDDRNLKLAFERLDSDHKGYITFDNVMDLMGRDVAEKEESMRRMWGDSMRACNSQNAQVTYEDFLLLMKGQTKDDYSSKHPRRNSTDLHVLHEASSDSSPEEEIAPLAPKVDPSQIQSNKSEPLPPLKEPIMPTFSMEDDASDGPLLMEEDDNDLEKLEETISKNADDVMRQKMEGNNFTPPQSPVRSSTDFVTPTSSARFGDSTFAFAPETLKIPLTISDKPKALSRRRSKSVDDNSSDEESDTPHVLPDTRRAMLLPEHTHDEKEIENLIKDETVTPLVVNRKLYRAHRKMRLAVLEASKRFEDQQIQRTREQIRAQQKKDEPRRFGAGLVMRHGHKKELSTSSIRELMKEKERQRQEMVEVANRRGGRGKRTRKKTISDMSGMLGPVQDEFNPTLSTIPSSPIQSRAESITIVAETPAKEESPELHLHETAHRKPTVPGVFHKTNDPFRHMGNSIGVLESAKENEKSTVVNSKSNGSMKVSVSDGELNQHEEDAPTPQISEVPKPMKIAPSPSWPPPPPAL